MKSAHPIEDKAGAPGTGAAIIARSTATEAQLDRAVGMLCAGEQSTFALRKAGVMQTSTRIFELRRRGYNIATTRRDLFDADGYRHERVAVYTLLGKPEGRASVLAGVRPGTGRAQIIARSAKSQHGLKRTREDKRRSVAAVLADAEWSKSSDREVARLCNVSHTLVANMRKHGGGAK